jgi:hypothetical protein
MTILLEYPIESPDNIALTNYPECLKLYTVSIFFNFEKLFKTNQMF